MKYKHPEGTVVYDYTGEKHSVDVKGKPIHWIILQKPGAEFQREISIEEFQKYKEVK